MKNLNILLSLNRFYPEVGGAETNLYFQANKLAENFDVTVFTPKRMESKDHEEMNGYKIFRFFDILNFSGKMPNLKAKTLSPGMFFKVLLGKRFDVIMCFPAVNYNNMLIYFAAKIRKIPIILCSFDLLDYAEIIKQEGGIDPNLLKSYQFNRKREFFFKGYDKIFAISNREIEVFRRYNNNVDYSPVPVKIEEYEKEVGDPREIYKIDKNKFTFLSLGRVSSIKGQDIALDSFISTSDRYPETKLVFVGRDDYEPDFVKKMKKKIKENNLESRVIFTGIVERDEVLGWLKYCDIHIIPVRFMNSGAVVVETWASGTPVIQSDAVDPNLVEEGKNGYLFKSEDRAELSDKMEKAIQGRSKLGNFAIRGNILVKEKYTYEYLVNLYEKAFSELI
ncbi:MAG: glycosyltransferase family 4 protein [Sedimenticola sp.]